MICTSIKRTLNVTRRGPGGQSGVAGARAGVLGLYCTLKGNGRGVCASNASRHGRIGVHGDFVDNDKSNGEGGSARSTASNKSKTAAPVYVIGNPIHDDDASDDRNSGGGKARRRKKTVPDAPVPDGSEIQQVVEFIQEQKRLLCITGAGCSTESKIPDYRSPNGAYSTGFKPMTHQQFMASEDNRSRYWARSYAGWQHFSGVEPNQAHVSLARLQKHGFLDHIITQNVDRLHHKAGSVGDKVLELHGTTHRVICMNCGALYPRELVQEWLTRMNYMNGSMCTEENNTVIKKAISVGTLVEEDQEKLLREAGMAHAQTSSSGADTNSKTSLLSREREIAGLRENPDGDVDVDEDASRGFRVPVCPSCKIGILKPDVVFFGDSLPPERTERSMELGSRATGVLVVGSSLTVWSAFRIVKAAKENGSKICIINVGDTRADKIVDLKINAVAGEVLSHVVTTTPQFSVPNI